MLRTEAQREAVLKGTCAVAKTANLIGDTHMLLIVRDLIDGPQSFSELEFSLAGVSSRTVTNKLVMLTEKGIITRTKIPGKPSRVIYELTEHGRALESVIMAMALYGVKYLDGVRAESNPKKPATS